MAQAQRILATVERPVYDLVAHMARRDGVSLSQKVRDIIREAVERDEDADLAAMVVDRKKRGGTFMESADFWRTVAKARKARG